MKILLAVCGSISFYKAYEILSLLKKEGFKVKVLLSKGALKFCTPLSFEALSDGVLCEENESWENDKNHIDFSRDCEAVLIAPASVNTLNRLANGICDDIFMQTLIATKKPFIIAPAANPNMLEHFSTKKTIEILQKNGVFFVEPVNKMLACGDIGRGGLADNKDIIWAVKRVLFLDNFYANKRILITAGGCFENIDDVRAICNLSSGKMGEEIAKWAYFMGANVVLLSSKTKSKKMQNYEVINYQNSNELDSLLKQFSDFDMLFMAAAVSDFVIEKSSGKISKKDHPNGLNIKLLPNKDLLKNINFKGKKIGFKLEQNYEQGVCNAKNAIKEKNLDFICLNTLENGAFGDISSRFDIFDKNNNVKTSKCLKKDELAKFILQKVKDFELN